MRIVAALLGCGLALVATGQEASAAGVVITALGDSITYGVVRSGLPGGPPMLRDPLGGYPGRLRAILGSQTRVLNRGLPGSATTDWMARPLVSARGPTRALLEFTWPDFTPERDLTPDEAVLDYVWAADRPSVVLVALGVNDLLRSRVDHLPVDPPSIVGRLLEIAKRLRAAGATVVVATLLPNHRDPPDELVALNAALLGAEPDCMRLDRVLEDRTGRPVLGDEIHPSPWGHALIARAVAHDLVARSLVSRPHRREGPR